MTTDSSRIALLLHNDHMATVEMLHDLEEFLRKHGRKRVPAANDPGLADALNSVRRLSTEEVGRHFRFEEGHLFPVLAAAGAEGMVQMLLGEHATILPLVQKLAKIAAELPASGFTEETWQSFLGFGIELFEREVFHIQKEEMGLLGAVAALIDPETDARLADVFAAM